MTRKLRLSLFVSAGALALALAGSSSAAAPEFQPQFFATAKPTPGATGVTLRLLAPINQDAAGSIAIGVPKGFTVDTSPGTGARLGTATVLVNAADIGHSFKSKGTVTVSSESAFGGDRCDSEGNHEAVWSVNTNISGRSMKLPVYVDKVSDPELADVVSTTLTVCPLAGDLKKGADNRAPLGSRLLDLSFTISAIKNPTAEGIYRWRTLVTPFYATQGTLNGKGAVEVQALSPIPVALSLKAETSQANRTGYTHVTVSGSLDAGGSGVDGAVIELFRGKARVARLRTKRGGQFTAEADLKKTSAPTVFVARLNQDAKDLGVGGCIATLKARKVPCIDATVAGYKISSKAVRITL
jgi:hypothetical protein